MTVNTAHPPGVFCWPELATTDADAAARFYAAVFDWSVTTLEGGHPYSIFEIEGESVSAAYSLPERETDQSPRWNSYVSVESADTSAELAATLGGQLIAEPMDVGSLGRLAAILDPTGAAVYLWEARGAVGAQRLNQPGCLCWTELIASDLDAAERFYTRLFGWTAHRHRFSEYVEFLRGEELAAGMLRTPPGRGRAGSHWLPYFAVNDVDVAVQVARRHFGSILGRPMDIPLVGRSAVLRDPQGATFGVFGTNEAA
jgi:hypothetical protein